MNDIRAGDLVLHTPSGALWLVAVVDQNIVHPIGWPANAGLEADCLLFSPATDAESQAMRAAMSRHGIPTGRPFGPHRTGHLQECWACGRLVGGGVCVGPHPAWELAPRRAMVLAIRDGWVHLPHGAPLAYSGADGSRFRR